jgi:hypothetical protein
MRSVVKLLGSCRVIALLEQQAAGVGDSARVIRAALVQLAAASCRHACVQVTNHALCGQESRVDPRDAAQTGQVWFEKKLL